jgi:flagellar biosynthesis/type III secretory pathway protein FliH
LNDSVLDIVAQLQCLEIDIELRDVWEVLDEMPDFSDDLQRTVTAMAMRIAYERGYRNGETAGQQAGFDDGHAQGYDEGSGDGATAG